MSDKTIDLVIIGGLALGGYFLYQKFINPDSGSGGIISPPASGRCDNLTGIPQILCNLGGFILGDPLCGVVTPQSIVDKMNQMKVFTKCDWQYAKQYEPTLYNLMLQTGQNALA